MSAPPQMYWLEPRPFVESLLVHMVIGYILYVVALTQSEPPAWAIGYIEQLTPTIHALETAARLSDHPFPAQVMILYSVISAVLLTMLGIYSVYFVKEIRPIFFQGLCHRIHEGGGKLISRSTDTEGRGAVGEHSLEVRPTLMQRLTWSFAGGISLFSFGYGWPTYFLLGGGQYRGTISGLVASLFSSTILSCTLLLFFTAIGVLVVVLCPLFIYLSTRRSISSYQY